MTPPAPPGQPDLYTGTPPGGEAISGGYEPIRTTPGRMANNRIVYNYLIRKWMKDYHRGNGAKHPMFLYKEEDLNTLRQETSLMNLPTLNYVLAMRDNMKQSKKEVWTAKDVKKEFAFIGINNTDYSEYMDAQTDGPVHSITTEGSSTMYNIFNKAREGMNLYFLIKKVPMQTSLSYVLDGNRTHVETVEKLNYTNIDEQSAYGFDMKEVVQVIPHACFGVPKDCNTYWKLGKMSTTIYIEEQNYTNKSTSVSRNVDEINMAKDINVFVNTF